MILFVTDQIAGAEYIYPLLKNYLAEGISSWKVVSSSRSASFFDAKRIPHQVIEHDEVATINSLLGQYRLSQIVLSASGNSVVERTFIRSAKIRGIHCTQYVDYWVNLSQRFKIASPQGSKWLFPDTILTLDSQSKQTMERDGIPNNIIEVIGQPYFEEKLGLLRLGTYAARTKLLLITQPVRKFYGQRLGYTEDTFLDTALKGSVSLMNPTFSVDVLVHPSENIGRYRKRLMNFPQIRVYQDQQPPLEQYSHALGMFSSMMVHTMLAGIHTASLQPRAVGEDMCHLSKYAFVSKYQFAKEVSDFLASAGSAPNISSMRAAFSGSLTRFKAFLFRIESAARQGST